MLADLKPYPEMRHSGVEWLGEVPSHWDVRKLAQFGSLSKGSGGNKDDERPTGVPCIRYGDLYTTHHNFIQRSRSFVSTEKAAEYTPTRFGDVLFASSGETIDEIGKSAVNLMRDDACCGGDVIIFRPTQRVDARYLGYVMDCRLVAAEKAAMGRGITVMHIYGAQLKYLPIPLPPLIEQAGIVRFLDHADRQIRRYIHAKKELIALLEEQKQAIIHKAVTGNIDVRTGHRYPAYRATGVECLGEIPKHWTLVRLKDVAQVQLGLTLGKSYRGLETVSRPYLRVANVQDGRIDIAQVKSVEVPLYEALATTLADGDVLMTEGGDIDKLGRGCVWHGEVQDCLHQNHIFAVRCRQESLRAEYLVGLMASRYGRSYFQVTAKKTTNLASTNSGTLRAFPVPLPSVDDQEAILRFVSRNTRILDMVIHQTEGVIERAREYLERLINDVVIGTVDVCQDLE